MPLITLQLFEFRVFFYHCVLFTHSQKIYTEYIKKLNYIFTCYDKTLKFQDDKKSGKIIICDITRNNHLHYTVTCYILHMILICNLCSVMTLFLHFTCNENSIYLTYYKQCHYILRLMIIQCTVYHLY